MKKKLLLLWTFLLLIAGSLSATEMTKVITFKDSGTSSDNSTKRTTVDEIITEGSDFVSEITEATNVYNGRTGRGLKLGAGSKAASLKLSLVDAVKPTKITFTAMYYKSGEQSITVNGKDFTELTSEMTEYIVEYDGNTEISEISISTPTARAYIGGVTIYYEGVTPAIETPVITGTTPFIGSTTVTIECATEGASVYYTTDDTTPTAESSLYEAPFDINATTTVNAIAVNGEDVSAVASKKFEAIPEIADIATLNSLAKDDLFAFTGDAVVVANPNNKYVFIKDATGSGLIYDKSGSTEFVAGSHITPNWTGKVDIYNGLFEAVPTSTLTTVEGVADVITYDEVAATDIIADNVNKVVMLKGVTYTLGSGKNFTITADGTDITGYNQFGLTIDTPAEGKTYDIVGAIGIYNTTVQFQPITITKTPEIKPVEINAETGADLTALVNAQKEVVVAEGDKVGDITINLASGGSYTVSGTLEAPASISINGNNATIDASALAVPFISMSATPSVDVINDYYRVDEVKLSNVTVNGIKNSIFYDNNTKYCVVDMTIDNCVLSLETESVKNDALVAFQGGGAKNFTIKNSTVYGNAVSKYFIRYNNSARLDRYGFDTSSDYQVMTYQNNTFNNILNPDGQWANYSGISGQKYSKFDIQKNIWVDCSSSIVRRLVGGNLNSGSPVTFVSNTYFVAGVDQSSSESSYDKSGTILVTDPSFADAENGDFTIGAGTQQAKEQTGDPRWFVEYDATQAVAIPVTIAPATDSDITVALEDAKAKVDKVGDITINLVSGGSYTVSGTLEAPASISINGNNATIDASALAVPFVTINGSSVQAKNQDGTENANYKYVENVKISDTKITGLTKALIRDEQKTLVENIAVDNSVIEVSGSSVIFDFNGSGYPATLTVNKSTLWSKDGHTGYLLQTSGRVADLDNGKVEYKQTVAVTNSTLHKISVGKQLNNIQGKGQKNLVLTLTNSIISECTIVGNEVRGWLGGQNSTNPVVTYDKNTYWNNGAVQTGWIDSSKQGADLTGTSLVTSPSFADAENGDFTIGAGTQQAKEQTGDPRWLVEYVAEDLTDAKAALLAEIGKATDLLGDADVETSEAAKALKDAIDKAQGVYDTAEFNEILIAATEELKAAEEAYKNTTSGINNVGADANADNGAWYNLQGVRVDKPIQKGIYIHNGKKIVIK